MDPESKTYLGYDLEVEATDKPGKAQLKFKPFSLRTDQLPDRPAHAGDKHYQTAEYRELPAPHFPMETFPSGQMIAVEMLKNAATGQRVVEYVEVSYEPIRIPSKAEPRDFQVADVILSITLPSLHVNGAEVPLAILASATVKNQLVWLSVPRRGRFLLSLDPYPGYAFQKAGVVANFGVSFSYNGDRYEFRTRQPITESSGNWNLYVLAAPLGSADAADRGFSFGPVNSVEEFLSREQ
jgi:hypothetical protein